MSELLQGLNDRQTEAVLHGEGPLLILAGAGSGKTRVLTHRIAYLIAEKDVSPYSIIALTFTNKAAGEMKDRVAKLVGPGAESIWVSTFHSSCVRILRRFIDTIGYRNDFVIYDADDQKALMKEVFKALAIDSKTMKEKTVLSVISHAKDELTDPERFEKEAGPDKRQRMYAACYKEYQKRLRENNALDFDDLIMKTIELFDINKEALAYYQNRFRYILVDEYQDTNSAQFMLIHMMAQHRNDEGIIEHNLCVVGDDDQSIYRFRGANIRNILDFEKSYPEAKVIRLEENYRSTSSILDVANEVIAHNRERKKKTLWTQNGAGEPVELRCYPDDRSECEAVVSEISAAVREGLYSYSDFAILYRTNAQSRGFEDKLLFRNIPYKIIGGQSFYQRKEIKDLLAYLRTIASGTDSMAIKRIINVPKRGIGAATIEKLMMYSEEHGCSFYEALQSAAFVPGAERSASKVERFVSLIEGLRTKLTNGFRLRDLIDEILEDTQYIDYLSEDDEPDKVAERIENINELISKIADYEDSCEETNEMPTLAAFLDEITLVSDIDEMEENNDKVLLMTIHSAKGLEFPNVFLVGMEEGVFPGYMSINADNPAEEIEEERRLCYVGITRAKEHLFMSYCKQRMIRGDIQMSRQSRFVDEIPRHMVKMSGSQLSRRLSDDEGLRRKFGSAEDGEWSGRRFGSEDEGDSGYGRRRFGSSYGEDEWGITRDYDAPKKSTRWENPYKKKPESTGNRSLDTLQGLLGGSVSKGIQSAFSADSLGYGVGDKVKHIKFGVGTVTAIAKGSKDFEVTVEFEAGVKKMLASFAKLVKV